VLFAACATTIASDPETATGQLDGKADGSSTVQRLPASITPWGGDDASKWTPEAIIANAVTAELQADPLARVSIPTSLAQSQLAPFGDGQTNAAASFVWWKDARPPVVGTRRGNRATVRFDRALPISDGHFEVWSATGAWLRTVASTRTAQGDWVIEVDDLAAFAVSPRGWRDAFPLSFEMPVTSIAERVRALPATVLPTGESIVDPVGAAGDAAYETLRATSFPSAFVNQTPYVSDTVHAAFPQGGTPRITAVGGASTWVAQAPFKHLYVCFDERAPAREAQYGVPSGAGWHHIGDNGETIVASLEASPFVVGYAAAGKLPVSAAYGLDRATTYALLQPGQAFDTPQGAFHWYAVHQARKACVQIWVGV
ncbi:MAG TPA: hypothetical protein VFO79_03330, partial [Xanthomonadales bacterium]|nr:hypothetical protein [Xanthomonadales bacterium]